VILILAQLQMASVLLHLRRCQTADDFDGGIFLLAECKREVWVDVQKVFSNHDVGGFGFLNWEPQGSRR
jgi:hypothetical protein